MGIRGRWPDLIAKYSSRLRKQVDLREEDEVGRVRAEYEEYSVRLAHLDAELSDLAAMHASAPTAADRRSVDAKFGKLSRQRPKLVAKVTERDERIAEASRRAADDREDVATVGDELMSLYANPNELIKHARRDVG